MQKFTSNSINATIIKMNFSKRIAKSYYYFNFIYGIYMFILSFIAIFYFLHCMTYKYPVTDYPLLASPTPTTEQKFMSFIYVIVGCCYWITTFKIRKTLIKSNDTLKVDYFWLIILFLNSIIIYLWNSLLPDNLFDLFKFKYQEDIIILIIILFPIIPIIFSILGLLSKKNME